MDYQLLWTFDRGLWNSPSSIGQWFNIRTVSQKKLESRPLPLECMDQVSLEALLAESMRLERELVPDFTRS
jgi:hypothetical protein